MREVEPNGALGRLVPVPPSKLHKTLAKSKTKLSTYDDTIDLRKHYLVGPFDFDKSSTIALRDWSALKKKLDEHDVEDDLLGQVKPL